MRLKSQLHLHLFRTIGKWHNFNAYWMALYAVYVTVSTFLTSNLLHRTSTNNFILFFASPSLSLTLVNIFFQSHSRSLFLHSHTIWPWPSLSTFPTKLSICLCLLLFSWETIYYPIHSSRGNYFRAPARLHVLRWCSIGISRSITAIEKSFN